MKIIGKYNYFFKYEKTWPRNSSGLMALRVYAPLYCILL